MTRANEILNELYNNGLIRDNIAIVKKDTGEYIDNKEVINSLLSHDRLVREVNRTKYLENRNIKELIIKTDKLEFKDLRRFIKVFIVDLDNIDLSLEANGIISKLWRHIRIDGSGELNIKEVNSKIELAEFLKISRMRFNKYFTELESKNIMKTVVFGKHSKFYFNPLFIRYGNIIDKYLKDLFCVDDSYFIIKS